jgi:hypothetical protein
VDGGAINMVATMIQRKAQGRLAVEAVEGFFIVQRCSTMR